MISDGSAGAIATYIFTSASGIVSLLYSFASPSGDVYDSIEEFDPGSERTLAAWLKHASRTDPLMSNLIGS